MQSRERVQRAIHFDHPDRVPIAHGVFPAVRAKHGPALDAILNACPDDFGWNDLADPAPADLPTRYQVGENVHAFGTRWRNEVQGMSGLPVAYPLADWAAYDSYRWPDLPAAPDRVRLHSAHRAGPDPRWYARGGGGIKFFEQMQQLRGIEALYVDIALDSKEFHRLLDDLLAFNLRWIDRWLEQDFDGLVFADDWGAQDRMLISPRTWRAVFKPAYAAMFSKVKAHGLNVHLHSDGMILDIIPDLIEIGVDVLNCQQTVIGLDRLRPFAGQLCFRTDLDRQHVLPLGSPAQVKEHVHAVFAALGTPSGGVIAFGEVGLDVPLANVQAMYEAFVEYGRYG